MRDRSRHQIAWAVQQFRDGLGDYYHGVAVGYAMATRNWEFFWFCYEWLIEKKGE
jgi:hypothetical protein